MSEPSEPGTSPVERYEAAEPHAPHPSLFEPQTLLFAAAVGVVGVIIGLELLTRVGITPNSSIIGAIMAIAVARIPLAALKSFGHVGRQNLVQTAISGATFGGANAILLPAGVMWLAGYPELVPIMMLGAFLGLVVDATILFLVFDSRVYPATGLWPAGIATAECIIAGDRRGKRARLLGFGALAGGLGQYVGIPMDVFGVCWIGNIWALTMFGLGLIARAYAPTWFGVDLDAQYAPHGIMIGAGLVALVQIAWVVTRPLRASPIQDAPETDSHRMGRRLTGGFVAFVLAAMIMASLAGLWSEMTWPVLVGFVLFAAFAAMASELIVGISAMHAGWFPAFATALIFLVLGMLVGFPPLPLTFLVGFTASTGPAFADMAYDLKAGWILRGRGKYPDYERQGRRQQYYAELLGFGVASVVIVFSYRYYFTNDLFPPVNRVYVATIAAGANADLAFALAAWAIPGAVIQLVGGPSRQLGILFATGLLIYNPAAGWTALVALAIRAVMVKRFGQQIQSTMYVLAGGFIAGSALTSFGTAAGTRIRTG